MAEQQDRTVQGVNPRSGEKVGEPVPETTAAQLAEMLAAAAAAAAPYGGSPPAVRIALLNALADRLDEQVTDAERPGRGRSRGCRSPG